MRISERFSRRTLLVAVLVVVLLGGAAAYAATTFPDVPPSHWAHDSIIKLADQGIILGHADGTFGPEENITRAQAATMFDRDQQYMAEQAQIAFEEAMTAPLASIARGCPACHATFPIGTDPAGPGHPDPARGNAPRYSLKWVAMGEETSTAQFALHGTLPNSADVNTCLGCHAAGDDDQDGNAAGIGLRTIAHPAHLFSGIFLAEFRGNCFSCHDVVNNGEFYLLTEPVEVNDKGIPGELPTPGLQEPSGPGEPPSSTTTTTEPPTTTTSSTSTTTTSTTSSTEPPT